MSKPEKLDQKEIKKQIGTPKIIFVLGGPATGKGTQCERLVEEFGYTHISTGDLMRNQINLGTKEGERIKKIVADGGIVPSELTVQILIQALLEKPSKSYLIDGFPRALDQAQYFEQNVCETQQVLFYDVPQEIMLERCMKRAETSGRSDDNPDTIKKRVQNYFDTSLPVIEFYQKFGKVYKIEATGDIGEVYAQTKAAVIPQTMLIVGPKSSGKTMISQTLSKRTNMDHIVMEEFIASEGLSEANDEDVCLRLLSKLSNLHKPRVIIENFPQNLFQAKFFLRNVKSPSDIFTLECSKDVCQERMTEKGEKDPEYVSSTILSQLIKQYHQSAKDLIPFLKERSNLHVINTEQSFEKTMEDVNTYVEPCVIHIRPGANSNDLRKEITEQLAEKHGFLNLDINALIRDENERKTEIGAEMNQMVQSNRIIPAEMIVRMLKKIIYCGQPKLNKYILTSFPDIIEQAKEFEANCSKISAIIYSTQNDSIVEIKNNNLSLFNIDSLFQKEFRLQTMSEWDFSIFNEKLGNKTEYGVVLGRPLAGKTTLAKNLCDTMNMVLLDMKQITEKVRASLGNEEEPFEGEVPIQDVEKDALRVIEEHKATSTRPKFVFDGFTHKNAEEFLAFCSKLGVPDFLLCLKAEEKTIKQRYCQKNEVDEVGEEQAEELNQQAAADKQTQEAIQIAFSKHVGRMNLIEMSTDASLETTYGLIRSKFSPKVILVNHEKRLGVDTTCSNLAIKYNMIYISTYQVIKSHIESKTPWGERLLACRRERDIHLTSQVRDEFNENEYSPVHFDQLLVMELLQHTIATKRTNQQFVLLEGHCNQAKLNKEEDRLELRFMDEFLFIEKSIGEIVGVIGLQFQYEEEMMDEKDLEYEKFPEPDPALNQPKPKAEDEEEAPADEEGEKKAPKYKPEDYEWTITNKHPKNLPQLFLRCKGKEVSVHEVKTAEQFSNSQYEAISRSLDEFCQKVSSGQTKYVYQQIIFVE